MTRSITAVAGYMSERHVWALLHDISLLLEKKHDNAEEHIAVCPENIDWDGTVFSLSGNVEGDKRFESPEHSSSGNTPKGDVWALGATVFYLYMGCHVLNGMGGKAQKEGSPVPVMRKNLPELSTLVARMLQYSQAERPALREICETAKEQIERVDGVKKTRAVKVFADDAQHDNSDFWPEDFQI